MLENFKIFIINFLLYPIFVLHSVCVTRKDYVQVMNFKYPKMFLKIKNCKKN